jgi:hypothetical protein
MVRQRQYKIFFKDLLSFFLIVTCSIAVGVDQYPRVIALTIIVIHLLASIIPLGTLSPT